MAFDVALRTELLQGMLDKVILVKGDVLSMPELAQAVKDHQVSRILHAASILSPAAYERPYPAVNLTVMGTLNVLECARIFGLRRVVFASSGKTMKTSMALARSADKGRLEITPDPYTTGKIAAELICNDYQRKYGMDVVIARLAGQIFGPSAAFTGALAQGLQGMIEKVVKGEHVKLERAVFTFSAAVISMLYAADAGRGLMMVTMQEGIRDNVFNIAAAETATLAEIADRIRELVPGARIEIPAWPEKGAVLPIDRAAKEQFGYAPEYDVRRGLREYIQYVKTGKYEKV